MRTLLIMVCCGAALSLAPSLGSGPLAKATSHKDVPRSGVFKDCADICPEMVWIPPGQFMMGSTDAGPTNHPTEGPLHSVSISYSFAFSRYPITVREFRAFVSETGYDAGSQCITSHDGEFALHEGRNWSSPDFSQEDNNPAVCINWDDANAYAAWLSKKTGKSYRIPSEAEYEYANRAGTSTTYWWGNDPGLTCEYANGADLDLKAKRPKIPAAECHDGFAYTSPVGRFRPNAFGLYDTTGNVWVWTLDCSTKTYDAAPSDGAPDYSGDCSMRMLRGGSWANGPSGLRSAIHDRNFPANRLYYDGIRVARSS